MRKKNLWKTCLAVGLAVMTLSQPVYAANWVHNNTGWWWHEDNGSYPANQWKQIRGTWYWFDSNGYMVTGWKQINGTWYYFDNSGAMASNKWIGNYYVESSGAMATNKWIGNYYVNESGLWTQTKQPARWVASGNRWWYRHSDGSYTKNGWETINGKDYLFDSAGWMLTGWQEVNGTWYYLESSGAKATNRWVGNYYVESNGAMATNKWIGNYYVNASGLWVETKGQHHWNDGVVTTTPTCTTTGVKTYTCTICGDKKTENIEKLDHAWIHHDATTHKEKQLVEGWTETINHPEEGHYETVTITDSEAWDEPIMEWHKVCYSCGTIIDGWNQAMIEDHIDKEMDAGCTTTGWGDKLIQVGTKHHDAITHTEQVWVVDTPAWTETIQHPAHYIEVDVSDNNAYDECSKCHTKK